MRTVNVLEKMTPIITADPVKWVLDTLEEDKRELSRELRSLSVKRISKTFSSFDCPGEGNIYKESDIQRMCALYNMKFLNLHYFENEIDLTVAIKMRDYNNKSSKRVEEYRLLAPIESFDRDFIYDPMLFVKVDNGWRLIHKWGNDLKASRLFNSLLALFTFLELRKLLSHLHESTEIKLPTVIFSGFIIELLIILFGMIGATPVILVRNAIVHSGSVWQIIKVAFILSILVVIPIATYLDRYKNFNKSSFQ